VVNLTRSLTFLKDESDIRVNCVCPGLVQTELEEHSGTLFDAQDRDNFKERRLGMKGRPALTADDIATAVLTLIHDDTINGKAFQVVLGQEWKLL